MAKQINFRHNEKTKVKRFINKKNETVELAEKRTIAQLLTRPDINEDEIIALMESQEKLFKRQQRPQSQV